MVATITITVIIIGLIVIIWKPGKSFKWVTPKKTFPPDWRVILSEEVVFYNALSSEEKSKFEYRVFEFILNCRITGVDTSIDATDKLLVAASAIIPVFAFEDWRYSNITEVLIYSSSFDENFNTNRTDKRSGKTILGMVGTGYMQGQMILSKQALRHGFKNEADKKNTAIHEFVHLIDKADGLIDGIPSALLEHQYAIPWIDLLNKKIDEILEGESDINPYGGTNRAEFFSVVSEYFFERPKLLQRNHPELYKLLVRVFKQDMTVRNLERRQKVEIGRNSPCPCGSDLKYKKCCEK